MAAAAMAAAAMAALAASAASVVQNVKMKEKIKLTYNWILKFCGVAPFPPNDRKPNEATISRLKYFVPQTVLINKKKLE